MNPFDQNSNFYQFFPPSFFPQSLQNGPVSIHILSPVPVHIIIGTPPLVPPFPNQARGGFPHFTGSAFQHFNGSAFQPPTNSDPSATINPGMFWQDPTIFNVPAANNSNQEEGGLIQCPNTNATVNENPEAVNNASQLGSTEAPPCDQTTSGNVQHPTRDIIQTSSNDRGHSSKVLPKHGGAEKLSTVHPTKEVATCSTARTDPVRIEGTKNRLLCEQVGQNAGEKLIRPCPLRYKTQDDSMSGGEAQVSSKKDPRVKGNVALVIEEDVLKKACDAISKATRTSDRLTEKRLKGELVPATTGLAVMNTSSAHQEQQPSGKQKRRKIQ